MTVEDLENVKGSIGGNAGTAALCPARYYPCHKCSVSQSVLHIRLVRKVAHFENIGNRLGMDGVEVDAAVEDGDFDSAAYRAMKGRNAPRRFLPQWSDRLKSSFSRLASCDMRRRRPDPPASPSYSSARLFQAPLKSSANITAQKTHCVTAKAMSSIYLILILTETVALRIPLYRTRTWHSTSPSRNAGISHEVFVSTI